MSAIPNTAMQRVCQLVVQGSDGQPVVVPAMYKIEFHISRQYVPGSSSEATFKVYNLGPAHRAQLYKNEGNPLLKNKSLIDVPCSFWAGYDVSYLNTVIAQGDQAIVQPPPSGNCSLCFAGYVNSAKSYRSGQDWITEIHVFDGGGSVGAVLIPKENRNFAAKSTKPLDAVTTCVKLVTDGNPAVNLGQGTVGTGGALKITPKAKEALSTAHVKDVTLNAAAWEELMSIVKTHNLEGMIDGQKFYINTFGEAWANGTGVPVGGAYDLTISDDDGIIGIPSITATQMEMELLLYTKVSLFQSVKVQVLPDYGNPAINGIHKVIGITHWGEINPSGGGEARTKLLFQLQAAPVDAGKS